MVLSQPDDQDLLACPRIGCVRDPGQAEYHVLNDRDGRISLSAGKANSAGTSFSQRSTRNRRWLISVQFRQVEIRNPVTQKATRRLVGGYLLKQPPRIEHLATSSRSEVFAVCSSNSSRERYESWIHHGKKFMQEGRMCSIWYGILDVIRGL